MANTISITQKVFNQKQSMKLIIDEAERGLETDPEKIKKYDNGHRNIDLSKTKNNVTLRKYPERFDALRKKHIREINQKRAERKPDLVKKYKSDLEKWENEGALPKDKPKNPSGLYKALRSDTADLVGSIIQPSSWIENLPRSEQTRFFSDCLTVMDKHPEEFGKVIAATIHYDETEGSYHMQTMSDVLDLENLKSNKRDIFKGGRRRLSARQTIFADSLREMGWDVERGLNRVSDPLYANWKSEQEKNGEIVNRYTDRKMLEAQSRAKTIEKKAKKTADNLLNPYRNRVITAIQSLCPTLKLNPKLSYKDGSLVNQFLEKDEKPQEIQTSQGENQFKRQLPEVLEFYLQQAIFLAKEVTEKIKKNAEKEAKKIKESAMEWAENYKKSSKTEVEQELSHVRLEIKKERLTLDDLKEEIDILGENASELVSVATKHSLDHSQSRQERASQRNLLTQQQNKTRGRGR